LKLRGLIASATIVGGGTALAAALIWTLLNVPESNVIALSLSTALSIATVVVLGVTLGFTTAMATTMSVGVALRRAVAAVPAFVAGLAAFALLWWITGRADAWSQATRGEIDATFFRYAGTPGTAPVHLVAMATFWLVRWAVGLSIVAGGTAAVAVHGTRSFGRGLRLSLRPWLLAVTAAAALLCWRVLWHAAFWRPASLPASSVEIAFAAAKLTILYALAAFVAAFVLRRYAFAAERLSAPRPATTVPL
jgi:hypothetical protein